MSELVLVTGPLRAGVDIIGALLAAMRGRVPRVADARTIAESPTVFSRVVKPFLLNIGADPFCQAPLPDVRRLERLAPATAIAWRRRVNAAIVRDAARINPPIFSSCSSALIWPIWKAAYPKATWIVCRRDVPSLVSACMRTAWMRAYDNEIGWERWAREYFRRIDELAAAVNTIEVWPTQVLDMNVLELKTAALEAGLPWDPDRVSSLIREIASSGRISGGRTNEQSDQ
jgi:hypothetical protein